MKLLWLHISESPLSTFTFILLLTSVVKLWINVSVSAPFAAVQAQAMTKPPCLTDEAVRCESSAVFLFHHFSCLHNCNKKVFFCFSFVETVHQLLFIFIFLPLMRPTGKLHLVLYPLRLRSWITEYLHSGEHS